MDHLCQYCSPLFPIKTDPPRRRIPHHPHVEALLESAKTCKLCDVIQKYWSLEDIHARFPDLDESSYAGLQIAFEVANTGAFDSGASWNILYGLVALRKPAYVAMYEISILTCPPGSGLGETSLWRGKEAFVKEKCATIKSWYNDCAANHPECAPSHQVYPKRLVEVGDEGDDPRLINTRQGLKKNATYATLSWCWGDILPLTTTSKNVDSHLKSIPSGSLPRTFREAIYVTRELGIPYIWIDSLCIVQDDLEDWREEAEMMKHIYSCSAITLSAMDAKNSTEGCFVDNDACILDPKGAQYSQLSVSLPQTQDPMLVRAYRGDIRRHVHQTRLSTRGWTLQEQLLSHREALCLRPDMHWKCRRNYKLESGLDFGGEAYERIPKYSVPENMSWPDMHKLWCKWMRDYSRRKFTYEKDRLSALVGIVHQFNHRNHYEHILASWKESMITDLLWIRAGDTVEPSRRVPGLPSWTWLSRATHVNFDYGASAVSGPKQTVEDCVKVVEASATWSGTPLVSDLEATTLVLEGPVRKLKLHVDPRTVDFDPPHINLEGELPQFDRPMPWRCSGQFDLENIREDNEFTCLLMRSVQTFEDEAFPRLWQTFLMLVPAEGDTYRRVGIAMIQGKRSEFTSAPRQEIRLV